VATAGTEPDLTVLVDILVGEIEARKRASGSAPDRMERAGRAFYDRVRKGYLAIARDQPGRFVVFDGMRNVNDIALDIRRAVEERLEQPHREEK